MNLKVFFIDNYSELCCEQLNEMYCYLNKKNNYYTLTEQDDLDRSFVCNFADGNSITFLSVCIGIEENDPNNALVGNNAFLIADDGFQKLYVVDLCLDHTDNIPTGRKLADGLQPHGKIIYTSGNQNFWRTRKSTAHDSSWTVPRVAKEDRNGKHHMVPFATLPNVSSFYEEFIHLKETMKGANDPQERDGYDGYYQSIDDLLFSDYCNKQYYGAILLRCEFLLRSL